MGDVLKGVGKVAGMAAPMAGLIPGLGPVASAALGFGGKLLSGAGGSDAITQGALPGLAGSLARGGGLMNNPEGQFDPAKALGFGGAIYNMLGQGQQRQNAQDYANSQIGMRNKLFNQLGTPPNYGITPASQRQGPIAPNLNQQSSATSGGY